MLVNFKAVWNILRLFGKFGLFMAIWYNFPVLVHCNKKNLATSGERLHYHTNRGEWNLCLKANYRCLSCP
jgi:hypothetical protein